VITVVGRWVVWQATQVVAEIVAGPCVKFPRAQFCVPPQLPVPGEGLEPGGERGLHLAQCALGAPDRGGHRLGQSPRELVDEREEEGLLVREVVVDGALRRFRGADDVVDHGPVIPFAGKHLEGRAQDPLARGDLAHRERAWEMS